MHDDLASLRVDYGDHGFRAADAGSDPMALFDAWFGDAVQRPMVAEANAMTLATSAVDGTPSARMVLLKAVEPVRAAFTWYTNLDSRKAAEATSSGRAALCWWWPGDPGRQVRAVGAVELVSRAQATAYFVQRPDAARVGAAASRQSRALRSRGELEERAANLDPRQVELPERWGGMTLVADEIEFWQGRPGRLHDRIAFLRVDAGSGEPVARAAVDAAGGDDAVRSAGRIVTDQAGSSWLRVRLEP